MTDEELVAKLATMEFYHTIELTPTVRTPGRSDILPIVAMARAAMRELEWAGKRVLDVGCRDGLLAFDAERLGAAEVVAFDSDTSDDVLAFLRAFFASRVRFERFNLLDLLPATYGSFDTVIFAGVLYHLRYPVWGLKLARDVLAEGGTLVIETGILVDDNRHAMLHCPTGAESPYEATSCSFFNLKGLVDTLTSLGLAVESTRTLMGLTHRAGAPLPARPQIDRCVVVARRRPEVAARMVEAYWEGRIGGRTWGKRHAARP